MMWVKDGDISFNSPWTIIAPNEEQVCSHFGCGDQLIRFLVEVTLLVTFGMSSRDASAHLLCIARSPRFSKPPGQHKTLAKCRESIGIDAIELNKKRLRYATTLILPKQRDFA
jgi:hypothetical protein